MKKTMVAKDNFNVMHDYLAQTTLLMYQKCSQKYDKIIKEPDSFNEKIHEISDRIFIIGTGGYQDFMNNYLEYEEKENSFFKDYGINEDDEELFRCLFFHHYLLRMALVIKPTNDISLFKTFEEDVINHRESKKEILRPIEKELGLDLP